MCCSERVVNLDRVVQGSPRRGLGGCWRSRFGIWPVGLGDAIIEKTFERLFIKYSARIRDQGAFQDVHELAYIARPLVSAQGSIETG